MTQLAEVEETARGLSPEQWELYRRIPAEVYFVPNPDFLLASAEENHFGTGAREIRISNWKLYWDVESEYNELGANGAVRLSAKDEAVLFFRYNYARYRLSLLAKAQQTRFSPLRAKAMLLWHKLAMEVRASIVEANMGLVLAMAKRRAQNAGVEFGELVAEGNMALLRAVEKFDASRGYKFSTYACRAILKAFGREIVKTSTYHQRFPVPFDPSLEKVEEEKPNEMLDMLQAFWRGKFLSGSMKEKSGLFLPALLWPAGENRR